MPTRVDTVITGLAGAPGYNRLYFAPDDAAGALASFNAVVGFWKAIQGYISSPVAFTVQGTVAIVNAVGQTTAEVSVGPNDGAGGTQGTECVPWASQVKVQFRTNTWVNGKRIRGGMFVPGLSEANCSAGVIAAGAQTAIRNAANGMAGAGLQVFSRVNQQFYDVIDTNVPTQLAVLRSRRD